MAANSDLPVRRMGQGLNVPALGLGCMGLGNAIYSSTEELQEEDYIAVIQHAIDNGCNFLDTSDVYGPFTNEELVGKAIKKYPREKVVIATKFGIVVEAGAKLGLNGSKEHCRAACEASLKRLGVDYIDLYYLHRKDPKVPIEETIAAMKELVDEGKVRYIGVSETSPADIRRGHAVHPISAVQLEWSLWSRDVEEEIVPTCRELGIGIVAYSPLGRGFLTGKLTSPDDLADNDWRRTQPRFSKEAFDKASQLALAWVLAQGDDVAAIPGTKRIKYLEENLRAASVHLGPEDLKEIDVFVAGIKVEGDRYDNMKMMSYHYE
ncbi:hypothetical protein N2152v2_007463 [Parachlorella kessleri]